MKTYRVVFQLAWIVIGGLICSGAISYKIGVLSHPRPGMFPFLIGCAIILLSCVQLVIELHSGKDRSTVHKFWPYSGGLNRVIALSVMIVFYVTTLTYLGYVLCTFVFFVAILKILGKKSWKFAFFVSVLVLFGSYMLFNTLLKINLPEGFLGM